MKRFLLGSCCPALLALSVLLMAGYARAYKPSPRKPWTKLSDNGRFVLVMEKAKLGKEETEKWTKKFKDHFRHRKSARKKYRKQIRKFLEDRRRWELSLFRQGDGQRKRIWATKAEGFVYAYQTAIAPNGRFVAIFEWSKVSRKKPCGSVKLLDSNGAAMHESCSLDSLSAEEKAALPGIAGGRLWRSGAQFDVDSRILTIEILQGSSRPTAAQPGTLALYLDTQTGEISRGKPVVSSLEGLLEKYEELKHDYEKRKLIGRLGSICRMATEEKRGKIASFLRQVLDEESGSKEVFASAMSSLVRHCGAGDAAALERHLGRYEETDELVRIVLSKERNPDLHGENPGMESILRGLDDPSPGARITAILALRGRVDECNCFSKVLQMTNDENDSVKRGAQGKIVSWFFSGKKTSRKSEYRLRAIQEYDKGKITGWPELYLFMGYEMHLRDPAKAGGFFAKGLSFFKDGQPTYTHGEALWNELTARLAISFHNRKMKSKAIATARRLLKARGWVCKADLKDYLLFEPLYACKKRVDVEVLAEKLIQQFGGK